MFIEFRTSKSSLHKSRDKVSADEAEERLLQKEEEAKITTRVDMADAKYVVEDHRNGDAKIELDANKRFTGLTKEELMKYAEDPFWVRLRWFMFVLFWSLWLCMLAGAIAIIVRAPRCVAPEPKTRYETGPLLDLDLADYTTAESHLETLQQFQVSGVFASACQTTYEVLEDSSCLDKFKQFAEKAKNYGIKIIVDLTANFVPTSHPWFQQSENSSEQYSEYFIWVKSDEHDPELNTSIPKPPNDWVSTVNTGAWSWSDKRKEFYLHQYGEGLADLNFHNPNVVKQFDEVIRLWMKAGAGGIRLHNVRQLLVSTPPLSELPHTGAGSTPGADHSQYPFWKHSRTSDQPQLDPLLAHWSYIVEQASSEPTVFTLAEPSRPELFMLQRNTSCLRPPSGAPLDLARTGAAKLLAERLPRWPAIKLTDDKPDEETAVFSMLLPAAPVMVLEQLAGDDNDTTPSESLKHAISLRTDASIQHGAWVVTDAPVHNSSDTMLAVARWKADHSGYVSVYNPGAPGVVSLSSVRSLPSSLAVHHVSKNTKLASNYTSNQSVDTESVFVPGKSAVIFSYVPKDGAEN
ncbi:unnamed protein product [Danaus chrysippus]|uniref:alpha-glucosidase n=1 Tax=Danaus chrysippus TaxID=151541 RepID=A0A8J2QQB6_9NEOP|nr:unnamed protein product [Danaus chrysippus]